MPSLLSTEKKDEKKQGEGFTVYSYCNLRDGLLLGITG